MDKKYFLKCFTSPTASAPAIKRRGGFSSLAILISALASILREFTKPSRCIIASNVPAVNLASILLPSYGIGSIQIMKVKTYIFRAPHG